MSRPTAGRGSEGAAGPGGGEGGGGGGGVPCHSLPEGPAAAEGAGAEEDLHFFFPSLCPADGNTPPSCSETPLSAGLWTMYTTIQQALLPDREVSWWRLHAACAGG